MFGLFGRKSKPVTPPAAALNDKPTLDISHLLERIEGVPVISASALSSHLQTVADSIPGSTLPQHLADVSRSWLATLNDEAFDGRLQRGESKHFMLMGDVPPDRGRAILAFAEATLARYREHIGDVIDFGPAAKMPVLTFAHDDDYYRYVAAYFTEGHYGLSSGMFIQRGLGHFVFPNEEMWRLEPVIAHELFHATVAHLPLPAWLNEGLATNAEFRFGNRFEDPRHAGEQLPHHRAWWNDERLQDFWSGDAFFSGERRTGAFVRSCPTSRRRTLARVGAHETVHRTSKRQRRWRISGARCVRVLSGSTGRSGARPCIGRASAGELVGPASRLTGAHHFRNRPIGTREAFVDFSVADIERWREAQDVVVACREEHHVVAVASLHELAGAVVVFGD